MSFLLFVHVTYCWVISSMLDTDMFCHSTIYLVHIHTHARASLYRVLQLITSILKNIRNSYLLYCRHSFIKLRSLLLQCFNGFLITLYLQSSCLCTEEVTPICGTQTLSVPLNIKSSEQNQYQWTQNPCH